MKLKEGIIIKSIKYQESSKIIYLINQEKMESLLVKGAGKIKSRNFSYSQEMTKINYDTVEGKGFSILKTGEISNNYSDIKKDFYKMQDAFQVMEYSYQFHEHIEDFQTFYTFLSDILDLINNNDSRYYPLIFKLKILYLLGIGPIFNHCVNCGSKDNLIGFAFTNGGMKCEKCVESNERIYTSKSLDIIKFLYLTKIKDLKFEIIYNLPNEIDEINKFINSYYNYYLGFNSRVNKVIDKMKNV